MNPFKMKAGVSLSYLARWLVLLTVSVAPYKASAQTTTWDWGFNAYGQLGNGSTVDSNVPVQTIPALGSVTKIAGGAYHNLALDGTSTVWAWGDNVSGQLGNGSTIQSDVPVEVYASWYGIATSTDIAAGGEHSLALAYNGTTTHVYAWGNNAYGQLGTGSTVSTSYPFPVRDPVTNGLFPSGSDTATAIAGGAWHSLAVTQVGASTSTVTWAWGNNDFGQLGNGSTAGSNVPVQVSTSTGLGLTYPVSAIAAGDKHSLALESDGTSTSTIIWAWGSNDFGQLGNNTTTASHIPVQVSTSTGLGLTYPVIAIAAGGFHSLALDSSGQVWAWGGNSYGQVGDGSTTNSLVPVALTSLANATAIAGGGFHSLALRPSASGSSTVVWAWGDNNFGELGDSTTVDRLSPVAVSNAAGRNATAIAGGWLHSTAIFESVFACNTTSTTQLVPGSSITIGQLVTDGVTVSSDTGCGDPTGTVTFLYKTPGATAWTTLGSATLTGVGGDSATATSGAYLPPAAATSTPYYFKVVYNGDSGHNVSASGDTDEPLTVSQASTGVTTLLSSSIVTSGNPVTDTVTINTSATGTLPAAGGSWHIEASRDLYTWTTTGSLGPLPSGTVSGWLPSTFTTGNIFLSRGLWFIRVVYDGDTNYSGSQSGDWDEQLIVL